MMRITLLVLGAFTILLVAFVVIGYALPVKHTAVATREYATTTDSLFAAIAEIEGRTAWRSGLRSVERVPSSDGKTRFVEKTSSGEIRYVVDESTPDKRLRTRIDDAALPFGGTWTYEISATPAGRSVLRITEDGEVYNPIFRFVSRFVIGHDATLRKYLEDLARRFPG